MEFDRNDIAEMQEAFGEPAPIKVDGQPILAAIGPIRQELDEMEGLTVERFTICAHERDLDVVDGQEIEVDGKRWMVAAGIRSKAVVRAMGIIKIGLKRYLH